MDVKTKSQRTFAAVTLITVVSVALVLVVYAAVLLGTMSNPGTVILGSEGSVIGTVRYSPNNADSWADSQTFGDANADWYARVELSAGYYYGPVVFRWQLQRMMSTWTNVGGEHTTSVTLNSTTTIIYVSGFLPAGNLNWDTEVSGQTGTYQVRVTVETA